MNIVIIRKKDVLIDGCHVWCRNCSPFRSTWGRPRFFLLEFV